jgi:hypothetical protein
MRARSREGIINDIILLTNQRSYHYDPYWLCFNVKLYSLDFSLQNLLRLWREYEGDYPYTHNTDWLHGIKDKYDDVNEDHLWEWAVEDARSSFVSRSGEGQDDDMYNHLWDGTEVDVDYAFVGRCGGWLAITQFNGRYFDRRMENEQYMYSLEEQLSVMDWKDLKKLYQLILMIRHGTREDARKSEVEWQAAFNFFANVCNDLTDTDRYNDRQLRLFDDQQETEEAILAGLE